MCNCKTYLFNRLVNFLVVRPGDGIRLFEKDGKWFHLEWRPKMADGDRRLTLGEFKAAYNGPACHG